MSSDILLSCKNCNGIPIEAEIQDIKEDCPICYETLTNNVTVWPYCQHSFCYECGTGLNRNNGCPMCGHICNATFWLSEPIKSKLLDSDIAKHFACSTLLNNNLKELSEDWYQLIQYMFEFQTNTKKFKDIGGLGHLKMKEYCTNQKVLEYSRSHAIVEFEGKERVIVTSYLPNCSIRLLIASNDDIDFDVDNDYADLVAGYLRKQISACWWTLSFLINPQFISYMFVRKFKNVTAYLCIKGNRNGKSNKSETLHQQPMKDELGNMKQYNFNQSHYEKLRKLIPDIDLDEIRYKFNFDESCCAKNNK